MYGEVFGSTVYGEFFIEGAIPEPELVGINDQLMIALEIDLIKPVIVVTESGFIWEDGTGWTF